MRRICKYLTHFALAAAALCSVAQAQMTSNAFTYQGKLEQSGVPANGAFDLQFRLRTAATGGFQIGNAITFDNLNVQDGLFTVTLNANNEFSDDAFDGGPRWLDIWVRPGVQTGAYTVLSPRQPLTAAPYALTAGSLALPSSNTGNSDALLVPTGLFGIRQEGTAHAIMATSTSSGAAFFGQSIGTGEGLRIDADVAAAVHATSSASRAGWFQIANSGNANAALYAATNGTGAALEGRNLGFAKAVAGYCDGAQGIAGYFRINNNANSAAALHAETAGNGPAVYAKATGLGPAVEIADGYIRVTGAGANTPTPIFVQQVTSSNRVDNNDDGVYDWTVIDNPYCNNDPNAILLITASRNATEEWGGSPPFVLHYDPASGRWWIMNNAPSDTWSLDIGDRYNVMIVKA